MSAIQKHPKLKIIFRINKFVGFSLPDSRKEAKSPQIPALWDVIILAVTFLSLCFTMRVLYKAIDNAKISSLSQPLVVALIYCSIIMKTVNLMFKRQQIIDIYNKMNDIVAFRPFFEFQRPVVDLVCLKIQNSFKISISIALICISGVMCSFAYRTLQIKVLTNSTILTEQDEITKQILHASKLSSDDFIVLSLHNIVNIMLHIKSIGMDSVMLLCHYFVVQQLKLLKRQFKNAKHYTHRVEKLSINYNQDLNSWMEMFNKVKK